MFRALVVSVFQVKNCRLKSSESFKGGFNTVGSFDSTVFLIAVFVSERKRIIDQKKKIDRHGIETGITTKELRHLVPRLNRLSYRSKTQSCTVII